MQTSEKPECNYTYQNQTERSYTNPSIQPATAEIDWQACREEVMENISYSQLVEEYGAEDVEDVVELVGGDVMQCAEGMGLPVGTPVDLERSIDFGTSIIANNL